MSIKTQNLILELICLLYVLLFVYAAVNKFLDFENFQVQLGQSPMLRSYVKLISYGVPITELFLSAFLLIPKTRQFGLYGAFVLMSLFSAYLFILLTYSDHIPCSCGGILEKLGWKEHLIFNVVFILIAILAILIYGIQRNHSIKFQSLQLIILFSGSVCLVSFLYLFTADDKPSENDFIRHFPHHPTSLLKQIDLDYNSYYIAGFDKNKIYLGNVTAPLTVTVIDIDSFSRENYIIQLPPTDLKFRALSLVVKAPYFYFYDGTTPVVYRGETFNWKAKQWLYKEAYFTHMVPLDSSAIAIKALSSSTIENIIGIVNTRDSVKVALNSNLLEKQIDGIFDTDGMLLYNESINQLVYTYYYRNQFLLIDSKLQSHSKHNTIDQTEKAQLKTANLSKKNVTVLAEKPLTVNKNTATYGDYIFINSGIMGNYEPKDMWNKASIIDVYSIEYESYLFSFYLPHQNNQAMSSFRIEEDKLVTINGHYLTIYQLKPPYFKTIF
ncbi:MAG: hypothetical protein Q8K02_13805 [Flavobacterium sp.]|nr:hypothetical protein [Flavobacterium sp.]